MKENKRKGVSLPMVIITMVIVTMVITVIASVIGTSAKQTQRMFDFMQAKYVATSGTQLALGAYNEGDGTKSPLFSQFDSWAKNPNSGEKKVTSRHQFKFGGEAEITITGNFDGGTSPNDYYITIVSESKIRDSKDYYVHTVVFNQATSGIRSEKGSLVTR